MRYSKMFIPTIKETPSDAEIISHQLMLRAGLIRKITTGIYTYLPLALKIIHKIEYIIRQEMHNITAQEIIMPTVQPAEIWQQSGRWEIYGKELLKFKDRHNRNYCFGPTHEEIITYLIKDEINTYRQLPQIFYQIQTKFRDEIRPRFGLIRAREFSMKDAYSFDLDEKSLNDTYMSMYKAYERIFCRCSIKFLAVEANSGKIGGKFSHEFIALTESGEDKIIYCKHCDKVINSEKIQILNSPNILQTINQEKFLSLKEVYTPHIRTVNELSTFLNVSYKKIVKTIIFHTSDGLIAVLIRGDEEINEIKLKKYLQTNFLELYPEDLLAKITNASKGFIGAVGLKIRIISDYSIMHMTNFIMGANKNNYHLINVNLGRDLELTEFADIKSTKKYDKCIICQNTFQVKKGIEIGHIFKLGTKYSNIMHANYLNKYGQKIPIQMGCYGIGIGRIIAAIIEQNYDDKGIIWPINISPYHVIIIPINELHNLTVTNTTNFIYHELQKQNIEVILDDRKERIGIKFHDADLIGIPIRLTISPKQLKYSSVEIKIRRLNKTIIVPIENIIDFLKKLIKNECSEQNVSSNIFI